MSKLRFVTLAVLAIIVFASVIPASAQSVVLASGNVGSSVIDVTIEDAESGQSVQGVVGELSLYTYKTKKGQYYGQWTWVPIAKEDCDSQAKIGNGDYCRSQANLRFEGLVEGYYRVTVEGADHTKTSVRMNLRDGDFQVMTLQAKRSSGQITYVSGSQYGRRLSVLSDLYSAQDEWVKAKMVVTGPGQTKIEVDLSDVQAYGHIPAGNVRWFDWVFDLGQLGDLEFGDEICVAVELSDSRNRRRVLDRAGDCYAYTPGYYGGYDGKILVGKESAERRTVRVAAERAKSGQR